MNNDKEMMKILEDNVRDLARTRAMLIATGKDEEFVTEKINEFGEKWGSKFEKMEPIALMLDLIEAGIERSVEASKRKEK